MCVLGYFVGERRFGFLLDWKVISQVGLRESYILCLDHLSSREGKS